MIVLRQRKIQASLTALVLALLGIIFVPSPAIAGNTYVHGNIFCTTKNVEGVWIVADNDADSGWATITPSGDQSQTVSWSYYGLWNGESYRVHVGCGGSPQVWEVPTESKVDSYGAHNFNCIDDPNEGTILYPYKVCQEL